MATYEFEVCNGCTTPEACKARIVESAQALSAIAVVNATNLDLSDAIRWVEKEPSDPETDVIMREMNRSIGLYRSDSGSFEDDMAVRSAEIAQLFIKDATEQLKAIGCEFTTEEIEEQVHTYATRMQGTN